MKGQIAFGTLKNKKQHRKKCFIFPFSWKVATVFSARMRIVPSEGGDDDALGRVWEAAESTFFPFEAVFTDPQLLPMPYLERGSPQWKTKLEGISLVLLK